MQNLHFKNQDSEIQNPNIKPMKIDTIKFYNTYCPPDL